MRLAWIPATDAFSPRLVGNELIYVSVKNDGHAIWKFANGRNALIVLQGQTLHTNFWYVDLNDGSRGQLTRFGHEFLLGDFDVSPDGGAIVFDRRQENSELALVELRRP